MQTDPTTSAPKFLGKYEVLARLDSGGMAEIFLARSRALAGFEKLVVLKRILPHLAAEEEFVSLFLDEAKTTVALSHGNIVQVFDMGKDAEGDYFIAMEWVAGKNLRRFAKRVQEKTGKPVPAPLAAYIASEILKGLDYAHRRTDGTGRPLGIVHRDVSPHNILISYEGEVKLTDFGIAKAAGKVSHTEAGFVRGKANYMSPEQAAAGTVDGRSDLFSVGVLMWELLTGESLHAGDNPDQVIKLLRTGPEPEAPSRRRPGIPPAVDDIVKKALARNPDDRFPTADVFLKELGSYLAAAGAILGPRDLAALVTDMFADDIDAERKQVAALPKAAIAPTESNTPGTAVPTRPIQNLTFDSHVDLPVTGASEIARDVRRRRTRAAAGIGAVLAAIPLLWLTGVFSSQETIATPTSTPTPVTAASPSPAVSPSAAPSPSATATQSAKPSPTRSASPTQTRLVVAPSPTPAAAPALLSISTNPWGVITIDGVPLNVKGATTTSVIAGVSRTSTPLYDYPIKPGRHVIRVELVNAADGKVLQRGEQTVELASGESKTLNIPMKPVE